jgi:hypothetical protein
MPEGAVDSNGNIISGTLRATPVTTFLEILDAPTLSQAVGVARSKLRIVLKCNVNLADSTVLAWRNGEFIWSHPHVPNATSLFACGPVEAAGAFAPVFTGYNENAENQLASQEGGGLSEAQIKKMSAVTLQVPADYEDLLTHLPKWRRRGPSDLRTELGSQKERLGLGAMGHQQRK